MSPTRRYPTELPPLGPPRRGRRPTVAERTLPSGLRVLVVRRPGVPLVELRLRLPFQGTGRAHLPRAAVLSQTLLSGTGERTATTLAADLQTVGGSLSASVDRDRLLVSGAALATGTPRLLELLADVLTGAGYPAREVDTERDRLADRLAMSATQPSQAARRALLRRFYGRHPYAEAVPEPEQVRAVGATALRRLHAERVVPRGAVLVLVGDVSPARTLDLVADRLAGWRGRDDTAALPAVTAPAAGPLTLVDRPGSVQSSVRLALPALGREHPDYGALQLANLVFGGYFSSRLVENIREDKGYTYSPHSGIMHAAAGSYTVVDADVATEVTGPALLEIGYEMGRLATLPVTAGELEQARDYATGTLALSVATQAGLASTLAALAGSGLDLGWVHDHPARLRRFDLDAVSAAAAEHLAPARAVTVVLGDAAAVRTPLAALGPVLEQ